MIYDKLVFPVFTVHTNDVELVDGILWIENQVLDDKNMKGETLGLRRLQSPHKNLYKLKVMIEGFQDFVHHKGSNYIDSNGKYFRWIKNKTCSLISHKIDKVEKRDIATLIWVKDIPFPFFVKRPPEARLRYASILYMGSQPSILYSFSETKQRKTWRKI